MPSSELPDSPELRKKIAVAYRDYYDRTERKRRWSVADDIPWDQCNPHIDPAVADVVKTFCMVELYLPDYLAKLLPQVRANRGRAWMLANWGYEEAKHSLVLGDWLLKSGQMTDEQMTDMEDTVFASEWQLPHDNALGMVAYTMVQEVATQLHYRNLRRLLDGKCPALDRVLHLVAIDEAAHGHFFSEVVALHLEVDREGTVEQIRRVMNSFHMPALHLLSESRQRAAAVRELNIFSDNIYSQEVVAPVLRRLGLTRADLRARRWKTGGG